MHLPGNPRRAAGSTVNPRAEARGGQRPDTATNYLRGGACQYLGDNMGRCLMQPNTPLGPDQVNVIIIITTNYPTG
jgi:hypothetical protein